MVQSDVPQLSQECNQWREKLHSYREEFNQLKSHLERAALQATSPQQLSELEHFQNQLHIQLINIHDLKQSVKANEKLVSNGMQQDNQDYSALSFADHHQLGQELISLENTLHGLREGLATFLGTLK
ncbi:MAG: hypothetical protein JSS67_03700 [Bacteroidetes bacterium]|nr:hypothetical protein [Bacteroidota bacterium]